MMSWSEGSSGVEELHPKPIDTTPLVFPRRVAAGECLVY